jgi:hypothetical protein
MFMYVTVRFRFGAVMSSVGAFERYSHICVFNYTGNIVN